MKVTGSGELLGASIDGIDLAQPLENGAFDAIATALGRYGVLRFPRQTLSARQLADFSANFGELEINVANAYQEPGIPQIMILSNVVENGKPRGLADAGQGWHTDMTYSSTVAFANVLHGIRIPVRDGRPLGATEFAGMHAAGDEKFARTFGGGFEEGRRFHFEKALLVKKHAGGGGDFAAEAEVAGHFGTAQIKIAILQA